MEALCLPSANFNILAYIDLVKSNVVQSVLVVVLSGTVAILTGARITGCQLLSTLVLPSDVS